MQVEIILITKYCSLSCLNLFVTLIGSVKEVSIILLYYDIQRQQYYDNSVLEYEKLILGNQVYT
jgi:hypothetical protein